MYHNSIILDIESVEKNDTELVGKDIGETLNSEELFDLSQSLMSLSQDSIFAENENSTLFVVDENHINNSRLKYLEDNITPLFLAIIKTEDFEFGKSSEGIKLIETQLKINLIATQNWFSKLYTKYYHDRNTLLCLLRVVEHLDKELLDPVSQLMALAAVSHRDDEVKELGVRIFENWGTIDSYYTLKSLNVGVIWLQEYIDQVISNLKEELCLS